MTLFASETGDGVHDVPALAVCERDALGRHLEVHHRGRWPRAPRHACRCGFGNGLGPSQRLRLHGVQVEHVTGWRGEEGRSQRA